MLISEITGLTDNLKFISGRDIGIKGIYSDSRKCGAEDIFVVTGAFGENREKYIRSAYENGCRTFITDGQPLPDDMEVNILHSPKPEFVQGKIASILYGNPSSKMKIVAVTGTNGKTSITHILYHLFEHCGYSCGLIGTIHVRYGSTIMETGYTTPDSSTLNAILSEMAGAGVEYVFMEASSHGLNLGRLDGIEFDAAVFTNLTRDHLDFHLNMEDYLLDKFRVFELLDQSPKSGRFGVICSDVPGGKDMEKLCQNISSPLYYYGNGRDFETGGISLSITDSRYELRNSGKKYSIRTSLLGSFNVTNSAIAFITGLQFGLEPEKMIMALETIETVAGRFQVIYNHDKSRTAIVDYAHTDDALDNILRSVKSVQQDRIYTLFGCGGDRDRTKRPLMAAAAEKYSDYVIVTSDNPRTEDPEQIIGEIEKGFSESFSQYRRITDRRQAIDEAVRMLPPGGILVVAGKGHEEYQIIGREKFHFSDAEELQKAFKKMATGR